MNSVKIEAASILAPTGTLRVSINVGNPILARLEPNSNRPEGISVDIARHIASVLGVPFALSVTERAEEAVSIVSNDDVDLGFFAVDPKRADKILFSDPYLLIEGSYLVRNSSPIQVNEDVDREEVTVVVSKGSAYDNFLARTLKHAKIDRSAGPHNVVATFLETGVSVAAGIRSQLELAIQQHADLRLLEGRFMMISQAIGVPRSRGQSARDWLCNYLETIKHNGTLKSFVERNGITGASIA